MISQSAAFLSTDQRGQMDNSVNFASLGLSNCLDSLNNNMMSSKNELFIGHQLDEEWNTTLPTPPRSPESSQATDEDNADDLKEQDLVELIGEAEVLNLLEGMELDLYPLVDDLLSISPPGSWNPVSGTFNNNGVGHQPSASSSELRHDCMWSGNCDDTCKQRIRYSSENSDIHLLTPASSPLRHCGAGTPPTADLKLEQSELEAVAVSGFVDPSAVLNYTPHSDHCYYQLNTRQDLEVASEPSGAPITVATAGPSPKRASSCRMEQYVLSDTPSESDDSEDSESNDEDEEEIDVVSVHSAALDSQAHKTKAVSGLVQVRAHQKSLTSHAASSQRSLLKSKNSLKTAAHRQRKQRNATAANVNVTGNTQVGPATPYLLTPVSSPQPGGSPAGVLEHPMPKVTSSGRVVQPTNRSVSFLEAQPQHSSRGEHHSRKRKKSSEHHLHSGRQSKYGRQHGSSRTCDVEDPEKRREHNSMERKRRDDLRFAFQKLRELVPELKDNPKAAKVTILSKAAEYSLRLQQLQNQFEVQATFEARRKRHLEKTLAALQQQQHNLRSNSSSNHSSSGTSALSV